MEGTIDEKKERGTKRKREGKGDKSGEMHQSHNMAEALLLLFDHNLIVQLSELSVIALESKSFIRRHR